MKLTKLLLTTTTALGLSMTAAVAGNNDAFTDQQGNNNDLNIVQSGSGNKAGTDSNPVTQENDDVDDHPNDIDIEQIGSGNKAGTGGDGIVQKKTENKDKEADNTLNLKQDGSNNEVTEASQTVGKNGSNTIVVDQTGSRNLIDRITQDRINGKAPNDVDVTMEGNRNRISLIDQFASISNKLDANGDGDKDDLNEKNLGFGNQIEVNITGSASSNGRGSLSGYSAVTNSSELVQIGRANSMTLDITGDRNQFGVKQAGTFQSNGGARNDVGTLTISGNRNKLGVEQLGFDNSISMASVMGNRNNVGLEQDGLYNSANVNVMQDQNEVKSSQMGDSNTTDIVVDGQRNDTKLIVTGDGNNLDAFVRSGPSSVGDRNKMDVEVYGDNNNTGSFSGDAKGAFDTANALTGQTMSAGSVWQHGSRNKMTIKVGTNTSDSSSNVFAALQRGDRNEIDATVKGGDSNQFAVAQNGDNNNSTFTQNGTGNNLGVTQ